MTRRWRCFALAAVAFVGTHFLLSHPLRATARRQAGRARRSRASTRWSPCSRSGWMIWSYGAHRPTSRHCGSRASAAWIVAQPADVARLDPVRRLASSAIRRFPAPGIDAGRRRSGVFAITRHPMMWGFALWAIVHLHRRRHAQGHAVRRRDPVPRARSDRSARTARRRKLMGERVARMDCADRFRSRSPAASQSPGAFALVGGTMLFLVATWAASDARRASGAGSAELALSQPR